MTGHVDSIAILRMHMLQGDCLAQLCWLFLVFVYGNEDV